MLYPLSYGGATARLTLATSEVGRENAPKGNQASNFGAHHSAGRPGRVLVPGGTSRSHRDLR